MIKNRPGGSVQDAPWMRYGGERCLGGAANLAQRGPSRTLHALNRREVSERGPVILMLGRNAHHA